MATRDSNAYLPDTGTFFYNSTTGPTPGQRPNALLGPVDEIYPEAVFKQNQLILNVNARLKPTLSFIGFYTANFADGDTGTASNSYNLKQDYGRAAFVRRNMVFLMGNYTGPWGITFNPFLIAQSGRPFNVTTQADLTGDNFFNDRPGNLGGSSSCSSGSNQFVVTSFGCLDLNPQSGETLLPANIGNSPASVAVNLRVSRSFGIGPKLQSPNGANGAGGQRQGGPGGPMGGYGGPGGGGRGGGGGGGYGPQAANTGHKYSLTFSAQALNLFNDINYGTPLGSIDPAQIGTTNEYGPGPRFEKSTSLAGGIFASPSGSASRRIFFQAAFNF
jgi:hypothetical protein